MISERDGLSIPEMCPIPDINQATLQPCTSKYGFYLQPQTQPDSFSLCIVFTMILFSFCAQWLAWQLATVEVWGSNPGKGDNLLISDL